MPGSPRSRPVTTTGAPKPPAPRAAGATTRPSASAKVDTCAFMEGMHSRGEESPRSPLRDAIGERCEKKGGGGSSLLPGFESLAVLAGEGPGTPVWHGPRRTSYAQPMPPLPYPRLRHRVLHTDHE